MALGFRDCCNINSYFYLSDTPTFVSENEVYFIITDDGSTFCAKYMNVPSLNYSPPTYSVNEMTLFTSCETCISTHACPTTNIIGQVSEGAVVTVNECACKTQFQLQAACYTIQPTFNSSTNGTAGISFAGGVPPYKVYRQVNGNYILNNTYTNQQPNGVGVYTNVGSGNYNMKLEDGNNDVIFLTCSLTAPPPPITLISTTTNPDFYNASNGSITFTIGGGTPPYNVTYNNVTTTIQSNVYQLNNLSAAPISASYSISVTDSGTPSQTISGGNTIYNPAQLNWPQFICLTVTKCNVSLQLSFVKTSNYLNLRPIYILQPASKQSLGLFTTTIFNLYYDIAVTKWVTTQINSFDNPQYNLFPPDCQVGPQSWKFESNFVQNPLTSLPQNQVWSIAPNSYLINPTISIGTVCLPIITQSLVSPSCQGTSNGTIQVIATGGVPPLTYKLQNGNSLISQTDNYFNQLSAGNYNLFITDSLGTNSTITTVVIPQSPLLTISMVNNCASTPLISEL